MGIQNHISLSNLFVFFNDMTPACRCVITAIKRCPWPGNCARWKPSLVDNTATHMTPGREQGTTGNHTHLGQPRQWVSHSCGSATAVGQPW